jgi:hypothetical protein
MRLQDRPWHQAAWVAGLALVQITAVPERLTPNPRRPGGRGRTLRGHSVSFWTTARALPPLAPGSGGG